MPKDYRAYKKSYSAACVDQAGFTLIEILISMAIGVILLVSLMQVITPAMDARTSSQSESDTLQDANFAMQQIRLMVSNSNRLFIPRANNPSTAWDESDRDVLAVTLPHSFDRDEDGWADANNDEDYLDINQNGSRDADEPERIDEDLSDDIFNNDVSGIIGIDDDGDGTADNGKDKNDDDEDGDNNEDIENGLDDDGDGLIDEDLKNDANDDGEPGVSGVDDDLDGSTDEGNKNDNDEDGSQGEDWYDPVVFFLNGTSLMQRIPDLNPADGTAYSEHVIAENVNSFQAVRQLGGDGTTVLLNVTLSVTQDDGELKTLNALIRLGGGI